MDAVVVGAGFAGSVVARQLANSGKKILVLEKRGQIGGNMFDSADSNGVMVHWYGPHIFHTNNRNVFDYLRQFADWHPYEHRVKGRIQGKLIPIPFNFTAIEAIFPKQQAETLKEGLIHLFPKKERVSVLDLTGHIDPQIAALGEFVFENVFVHYTAKQWGMPVEKVDTSVINRVPVVIGYDDRYFKDTIQMMPDRGFSHLFEKLLDHHNITVCVDTPASCRLTLGENKRFVLDGQAFTGPVVYTGPIDELFDYRYGKLPYRSLDLRFEQLSQKEYQPAAVVNYPNEEKFTRITEFKKLTGQTLEGATTILREYPMPFTHKPEEEAYYPIENPENRSQYEAYATDAVGVPGLYLCGRLAEYKYYNMDGVVERALLLANQIAEGKP